MSYFNTDSFKNLIKKHKHAPPHVVIIDTQGKRDEYFKEFVLKRNWNTLAQIAGVSSAYNQLIIPVLWPEILDEEIEEIKNLNTVILHNTTILTSPSYIKLNNRFVSIKEIRHTMQQNINKNWDIRTWERQWLDMIAWSAGYAPFMANACWYLAEILEHEFHEHSRIVGVFNLDIQHPVAVSAILNNILYWPKQLNVIGAVVFCSQELIVESMRQDASELLDKYCAYKI